MIVAVVDALTAVVVTAKVAVEFPALTTTFAGTVADELLLDRATVMSATAGPLKVTVPVDEAPPVTVAGFKETADNVAAGLMVRIAVSVAPA